MFVLLVGNFDNIDLVEVVGAFVSADNAEDWAEDNIDQRDWAVRLVLAKIEE